MMELLPEPVLPMMAMVWPGDARKLTPFNTSVV